MTQKGTKNRQEKSAAAADFLGTCLENLVVNVSLIRIRVYYNISKSFRIFCPAGLLDGHFHNLFFCPAGPLGGHFHTNIITFDRMFCPAGPLGGNVHTNFITYKTFLPYRAALKVFS